MAVDFSKEHMVIALWLPRPAAIIAEIERRLPGLKVTYVQTPPTANPFVVGESCFDKDVAASMTILVTFAALPNSPEEAPRLKHIHFLTAGIDHAERHPVIAGSDTLITTSSGVHSAPIGEWVLMMALAVEKHLPLTCQRQREHTWLGKERALFASGNDWVGKTVGIAGYGSIGRQVARIFVALGASVIAYTANPRTTSESRRDNGYIVTGTGDPEGVLPRSWMSGASKEAFHTFLRSGLDCLVLTLPLTQSTTGLLSKSEFEILRDSSPQGCILINISRGKMINQPALIEALGQGWLRGAALDVTEPEPLPQDDPLWDAKNLIITPHVSPLGKQLFPRAFDVGITNLERQARGETMFNVVDRKKGY